MSRRRASASDGDSDGIFLMDDIGPGEAGTAAPAGGGADEGNAPRRGLVVRLLVAVGVAGVLGVVAITFAGGGSEHVAPAPSSSLPPPATTFPLPSTTAPEDSSTAEASTVLDQPPAPPDVRLSGTTSVLWGIQESGATRYLTLVELGSGGSSIRTLVAAGTFDPQASLELRPVFGGVLVSSDSRVERFYPSDAGPAVAFPIAGVDVSSVFPTKGATVWVFVPADGNRLTEVTPSTGAVGRSVTLPKHGRPRGIDGQGQVLLEADAGGVYRLDPATGRVRQLSDGRLRGLGPRHVLIVRCDGALRCGAHLIDLVSGADQPTAAPAASLPDDVAALSSDGHWLVGTANGRVVLLDLRSSSAPLVDTVLAGVPPTWAALTADGTYVLAGNEDGSVAVRSEALMLRDGRVAALFAPLLTAASGPS